MQKIGFRRAKNALPRFELGDRVIIQPGGREGTVIGVRYGDMAYDVRCGATLARNLPPKALRLAPPALAIVA